MLRSSSELGEGRCRGDTGAAGEIRTCSTRRASACTSRRARALRHRRPRRRRPRCWAAARSLDQTGRRGRRRAAAPRRARARPSSLARASAPMRKSARRHKSTSPRYYVNSDLDAPRRLRAARAARALVTPIASRRRSSGLARARSRCPGRTYAKSARRHKSNLAEIISNPRLEAYAEGWG